MTVEKLHKACFHELETRRLLLRPLREEDAEAMFAYTSVPVSFRYLRRSPHTSVEEDRTFIRNVLEGYQRHQEFVWGICFLPEERLIGTCRLFDLRPEEGRCEVSYLIHPEVQGRGTASEAVARLIRFAFDELNFRQVLARCAAPNIGSERVMQKCGMTKREVLPRFAEFHGVCYDFLLYGIEKET